MTKKLAIVVEWLRPFGILFGFSLAEFCGKGAISKFHILGPFITCVMCGSTAIESLFLGDAASAKVGYASNREYQVQWGLSNLAMTVTAVSIYVLNWGKFADATITVAMLLFFTLSAVNHTVTLFKDKNMKPANIMRPVFILLLLIFLIPDLLKAIN